jgi:hypothetical protein
VRQKIDKKPFLPFVGKKKCDCGDAATQGADEQLSISVLVR